MLDGEVSHIGPDASDDQQANKIQSKDGSSPSQSLAYKALVSLNSQVLQSQGNQLKLVPGMQVIVEINQGKRTVMEYLLSPVQKALHDSGRER